MALVESSEDDPFIAASTVTLDLITGKKSVDASTRAAADRFEPMSVGRSINRIGTTLMGEGHIDHAEKVFRLNTRLWPELPNPWDSLGECSHGAAALRRVADRLREGARTRPRQPNRARADRDAAGEVGVITLSGVGATEELIQT